MKVHKTKNIGEAVADRDVKPSGVYTGDSWYLTTAFGSPYKTIVKGYDPRVYPENESIRIALVDPASEVPVEVAEANARLIAAAPELYEALRPFANTPIYHFEQGHTGIPSDCPECGPVLRAMNALALADKGAAESEKRHISKCVTKFQPMANQKTTMSEESKKECLHNFLLAYERCGIRFNIYVIARDWQDAKSKAPKGARNVNAEWMP